MNEMCIHKGPGKFSSCTDEYIYHLDPDEEINIGDTWYGRFSWPFLDFKDETPLDQYLYDTGYEFPDDEKECILDDLKNHNYKGVIVEEVGTGFVNVKYYDSKQDFENGWDNILADEEEYNSGEED